MAITGLDEKTALVVVDTQKAMVGGTGEAGAEVVAHTAKLATAFRAHGLPVIWIKATGMPQHRTGFESPGEGLPEEMAQLAIEPEADDHVLEKFGTNAFLSGELGRLLEDNGVTGIVVTGIATGVGVESTVRAGFDSGFNVTVAADATADFDGERKDFTLARTIPVFAEVGTTEEIITAL